MGADMGLHERYGQTNAGAWGLGEVPQFATSVAQATEALAHLMGCLRRAVELLDETGADGDARVVEAHAAQLAAGREWPGSGDAITSPPSIWKEPGERV